jgi:hypothetical protein
MHLDAGTDHAVRTIPKFSRLLAFLLHFSGVGQIRRPVAAETVNGDALAGVALEQIRTNKTLAWNRPGTGTGTFTGRKCRDTP